MPALEAACAVAGDAIAAAVCHADGDIDHLLDERVERTRRHHGSKAVPCPTQRLFIVGKIFPEVIDVVELPRGFDLVVYGLHGVTIRYPGKTGWLIGIFVAEILVSRELQGAIRVITLSPLSDFGWRRAVEFWSTIIETRVDHDGHSGGAGTR
jgi:hypothetical protein